MKQLLMLCIVVTLSFGNTVVIPRLQVAAGINHHPGIQGIGTVGFTLRNNKMRRLAKSASTAKRAPFSWYQFQITPTVGVQVQTDFTNYSSVTMSGGEIGLVDIPAKGVTLGISGHYLYGLLNSSSQEGWRCSVSMAVLYFAGLELAYQQLNNSSVALNFFWDFGDLHFGWK